MGYRRIALLFLFSNHIVFSFVHFGSVDSLKAHAY
jgi:hypothetical protein